MAIKVEDAIVLLGDSLTQGSWQPQGVAQRLAESYVRKLDVINRGYSGYNTRWIIPVLEQMLAQQHEQANSAKIRLMVIWFGANDACIEPSPQHVPLEEFSENLLTIINMIKSVNSAYYSPSTRVILLTAPPLNSFQRPEDWSRKFEVTAAYAQAARDVGSKAKVPVVDVYNVLWEAASREEKALDKYLNDGLHLTGEGYTLVYDALIETIKEKYPDLHYDALQMAFPHWSDIDPLRPRQSLAKRKINP